MAEFSDREFSDTICLFDVDNTLTPAMRSVEIEMVQILTKLRERCVIGFLGGSNLTKITNQLGGSLDLMLKSFDYGFAENGLTAFRLGKPIETQSFINFIGEDKYKQIVNFCLHYIADIDIPIKRGTFIEYRTGMINISPIGRNASIEERNVFEEYDKKFHIRKDFVERLRNEFPDCGLTFSIGGQISFDVFPTGWDKTYALRHIEADKFKHIHFFGDKTFPGGNDYEIYSHPATIGHAVTGPEDTIKQIRDLFKI